ncbi:hypothetical protein J2X05_000908 [Cellvibrio fibrivorans]|uniref:Uncharacterized protein n=1 Tax=Cellvibrio fibrivorans TaxID=126350 RepID=A0ABU1UUN6_9GAMM|nr:hypothetical protein [Cellvibrio fibrivorans]
MFGVSPTVAAGGLNLYNAPRLGVWNISMLLMVISSSL